MKICKDCFEKIRFNYPFGRGSKSRSVHTCRKEDLLRKKEMDMEMARLVREKYKLTDKE